MVAISYGRHFIESDEIAAAVEVLSSDYLTLGPRAPIFENLLKDYLQVKYVYAVSSGTAALHCAFNSLPIKKGGTVIVTPLTFISTVTTIIQSNLNFKFADINTDTGNLQPESVLNQIDDSTLAICTVDYAGNPSYLDELLEIKVANNLFLIEDASHSLGSIYNRTRIGSHADITTFSFFPTKNITSCEGGAVATNSISLANKIELFKNNGIERDIEKFINNSFEPWIYEVQQLGLNYRISDIHAAVGIIQLGKIERFKQKRSQLFESYHHFLNTLDEIKLPKALINTDPMWHLFPIQVPPDLRTKLFNFLHDNGIKVQVNYIPLYHHPYFKELGIKSGDFPNCEKFYQSEISLPLHYGLEEGDVEHICELIWKFFGNHRIKSI